MGCQLQAAAGTPQAAEGIQHLVVEGRRRAAADTRTVAAAVRGLGQRSALDRASVAEGRRTGRSNSCCVS